MFPERKTNKDRTEAQHFHIPREVNHPEIDCYTHISTWKAHLLSILKRPLSGDDFRSRMLCWAGTANSPHIAFVGEEPSIAYVGGLEVELESGNVVGTIMRYLLDELMAYEEGFSDIMMDDQPLHRHESFKGDDETAATTKADLLEFEGKMLLKMQAFFITIVPTLSNPTTVACAIPDTMNELSSTMTSAPGGSFTGPSHIPETNSLADALHYWQHGAPEKDLVVPLNQWSTFFKSSEYSTEAVKLGNIRFVCEEFLIQCEGNEQLFEERYPRLQNKFTKLMKAIRVASHSIKGDGELFNRQVVRSGVAGV
ncbi:hypothetical protein C8J57DRAFT_1236199 [Mycena rebaudengoi]|nr:hypothetical protein C8J57DRAFT_1236199 [Mycena rebaudengoi]